MQYRSLTKDNIQVSALGFGCMRFPTLENGKPDVEESIRMLHYGIDHGINYIDTALPYHDGESEVIVGKAIKQRDRDKLFVATKFPVWDVTSESELDPIFEKQLKSLDLDHIDFYLLHNLQKSFWGNVQKLKMIDWVAKKRDEGKIRYIGFSFHDDFNLFREVIDVFDWDLCQIQYNYVCETVQAGTEGLKYAAGKGISVVIMEPLFGGVLVNPVGPMGDVWKESGRNPVDLALRWLWDKPEVSLVLSGMSSMDQTVENVAIAERSSVNCLTDEERAIIEKARLAYEASTPVKCTKCGYCLPCPFGVDIPKNFELYNSGKSLPGSMTLNKILYSYLPETHRADHCTECGECEGKCPQHLPIRQHLKETHELLG